MSGIRFFLSATLLLVSTQLVLADEKVFHEALTAFQNKKFAEAKVLFERTASEYPAEANVLHNWALTEVELGHKGLAIALWRKALSLDPQFAPARAGRDYLEGRYQIRPLEKSPWDRAINRQLENLSFDQFFMAMAMLLSVVGWLWLRFLKARRFALEEAQPSPQFPTVATIFSVLLLLIFSAFALKVSFHMTPRATIVVAKADVKSLPSDQGATLYDLAEGNEVLVKRSQNEWLQVTNSDGLTGWVRNNQLMITLGW